MSLKIKGVPKARSICLRRKLFSLFFTTEFFFTSSKDPVGFYTSGRIIITFTNRAERKGAFVNIPPLSTIFAYLSGKFIFDPVHRNIDLKNARNL